MFSLKSLLIIPTSRKISSLFFQKYLEGSMVTYIRKAHVLYNPSAPTHPSTLWSHLTRATPTLLPTSSGLPLHSYWSKGQFVPLDHSPPPFWSTFLPWRRRQDGPRQVETLAQGCTGHCTFWQTCLALLRHYSQGFSLRTPIFFPFNLISFGDTQPSRSIWIYIGFKRPYRAPAPSSASRDTVAHCSLWQLTTFPMFSGS